MSTSVAAPPPTTHKSLLIQSENKGLWFSWTGIDREWNGPQERVLLRFCQKTSLNSLRELYSQLCLRWISSQQNPSPRSQICTSALLSLPLLLIVLFCSSCRTSSLKNRTCVSRLASTPDGSGGRVIRPDQRASVSVFPSHVYVCVFIYYKTALISLVQHSIYVHYQLVGITIIKIMSHYFSSVCFLPIWPPELLILRALVVSLSAV